MFPALDEPQRSAWARKVSTNARLRFIYGGGSITEGEYLEGAARPFERGDYLGDHR